MKLKDNFILRQVADAWVVLPIAEATAKFNGMLSLNETGAMLWKLLQAGADKDAMVDALTKEYNVTRQTAMQDVEDYLQNLEKVGCMEI